MRPGGKPDFCRQLSTKLMKCGSMTAESERFTENAGGSFFQTLGFRCSQLMSSPITRRSIIDARP